MQICALPWSRGLSIHSLPIHSMGLQLLAMLTQPCRTSLKGHRRGMQSWILRLCFATSSSVVALCYTGFCFPFSFPGCCWPGAANSVLSAPQPKESGGLSLCPTTLSNVTLSLTSFPDKPEAVCSPGRRQIDGLLAYRRMQASRPGEYLGQSSR